MIHARGFAIEGILDDASFEVQEGEIALLSGPSGAGKTLLLRAIAGLDLPRPTRGALSIAGLDCRRVPPARLAATVALVFQDASERLAAPDVKGALALRLSAARVPPSVAEPIVLAAAARLGLEPDAETTSLSEGEAKRVAFEAALLSRPRVLLLDEPLAGLDPGARRESLLRIAQSSTTCLIAEHRVEEVAPIATTRLAFEGARVARRETPLALA